GIFSADVAWNRKPLYIGLGLARSRDHEKVLLPKNRVIAFEDVLPVWVYQPAVHVPRVLWKPNPPSIRPGEVVGRGLGWSVDARSPRVSQGRIDRRFEYPPWSLAHSHDLGFRRFGLCLFDRFDQIVPCPLVVTLSALSEAGTGQAFVGYLEVTGAMAAYTEPVIDFSRVQLYALIVSLVCRIPFLPVALRALSKLFDISNTFDCMVAPNTSNTRTGFV